jgi:hypothetical protein
MIARRFLEKCHPRSSGLSLRFLSSDEGFDDRAFFMLMFEKCHPRLRTLGYLGPWFILTRLCECLSVELRGLILNLGPVGIFMFSFLLCVHGVTQLSGPFSTNFYIYSSRVTLVLTFICSVSPLALSWSLLHCCNSLVSFAFCLLK